MWKIQLKLITILFSYGLVGCFVLVSMESAYARRVRDISKYLQEIFELEKEISKVYSSNINVNSNLQSIKQTAWVHNCKLDLKTYGQFGLLFQDEYNLSSQHPHRMLIRYHGTYGIAFGVIPRLKIRSNLYFANKEERKASLTKLRRLSSLCHYHSIKSYFNKLNGEEEIIKNNREEGSIWNNSSNELSRINQVSTSNWMSALDGELSFYERYHSLYNARKSFLAEYLIFRGDESGKILADLMIKKRAAGLDVGIIVDAFSNFEKVMGKHVKKNTFIMYNNLMAAGIRVFGYACNNKFIRNEFRGLDLGKLIRRTHEKMWIVDGEWSEFLNMVNYTSLAIVGGINLGQEYFHLSDISKNKWRDQDVGIKGPLVKNIYLAFKRNMQVLSIRYKSYNYDKLCFNPYDPIRDRVNYLEFKKTHTRPYLDLDEKEMKDAQMVRNNIQRVLSGYMGERDRNGRSLVSYPVYVPTTMAQFLDNRPDENEKYIFDKYLKLIKAAKNEILISNSYFIPPKPLIKELIAAAARGVKVRILTNSYESNEFSRLMTIMSRYRYMDLVKDSYQYHNPEGTPPELRGSEELKIYEWRRENEVNRENGISEDAEIGDAEIGDATEKNGKEDSEFSDEEMELDDEGSGENENLNESDPDDLNDTTNFIRSSERMSIDREEAIEEAAKVKFADGTLHAKFMVVDGEWGIVGSFNLDYSSHRNSESVVFFHGKEIVDQLKKLYEKDLACSQQVTMKEMEEYRKPKKLGSKIWLWIARLIEKYL